MRRDNKREDREEDESAITSSNKKSKPTIVKQTGTKRTASKIEPPTTTERTEEPEAKVPKDENSILAMEVCEFYSMPRIAPKAVGKYINKGTSFDRDQR